jgi:hypothetical protein
MMEEVEYTRAEKKKDDKIFASMFIAVIFGSFIISGCVGQIEERNNYLGTTDFIELRELIERPEYHYEERVNVQGYVLPEHLFNGRYGEEMLCRLAEEPNKNASFIYILTGYGFDESPEIERTQYDKFFTIYGKVEYNGWAGYHVEYRYAEPVESLPKYPDIFIVTVTVTETFQNETKREAW